MSLVLVTDEPQSCGSLVIRVTESLSIVNETKHGLTPDSSGDADDQCNTGDIY